MAFIDIDYEVLQQQSLSYLKPNKEEPLTHDSPGYSITDTLNVR